MKKLSALLLTALITLLALPTFAEPASTKVDSLEARNEPLSRYEVTIDRKLIKDPKSYLAKIEGSEVFKASECSRVATRKKGVYSYACIKVTCQTDELFRGLAQPGVRLNALTAFCPLGCFWATTCSGDGTYACCRIPVPGQRCPGVKF